MRVQNLFSCVAIAFFAVAICSCAGPKKNTGVWVNQEKMAAQKEPYKSIYIFAQTPNIEAKQLVEDAVAARAKEIGYTVVKSIAAMPPTYNDGKPPSKEEVLASVKKTGCDAIFVITMIKKEASVKYTPGVEIYSPAGYYSWSGSFFGYYNNYASVVSTPGYYDTEKEYVIQSNLFDVDTQALMFSVQSNVFNPASLTIFTKDYVNELVLQMDNAKLFSKITNKKK